MLFLLLLLLLPLLHHLFPFASLGSSHRSSELNSRAREPGGLEREPNFSSGSGFALVVICVDHLPRFYKGNGQMAQTQRPSHDPHISAYLCIVYLERERKRERKAIASNSMLLG
jgi:hypothetical protein